MEKRHPEAMGGAEVEACQSHLAVDGRVSASTQTQALCAILFLYKQVLRIDLPHLDAVRAKRPKRLPVVLSRDEVRRLLVNVEGSHGLYRLMAGLMYGSGLRLMVGAQYLTGRPTCAPFLNPGKEKNGLETIERYH